MAILTNPTDLARETLKLMAVRRIAPTPENYQRYYHEIAGTRPQRDGGRDERVAEAVRQAANANPTLIALGRLARALEDRDLLQFNSALVGLAAGRDGSIRHDWGGLFRDVLRRLETRQSATSLARRKEGLERVLINFGADPQLFDKLQALLRGWNETSEPAPAAIEVLVTDSPLEVKRSEPPAPVASTGDGIAQMREVVALTLEMGVAARLERFPELSGEARSLAQSARDIRGTDGWTRFAAQLRQFFFRIEVWGETDAELLDALLRLLGLLVNNIAELVEDDQWLSGQLAVIRDVIDAPLSTERIHEAERRFKDVLYKQGMLKHSLREAKSTLKSLIGMFVSRLSDMTESTTDYHQKVENYAGRLAQTDDIQDLKLIVDEIMADTRSMQVDMQRYRDEMVEARRHAEDAEVKVRKLEAELEQVSEQVSQDQLTGALNRRGLDDAMQREMARAERKDSPLCVAVLDLDNFKRLNDTFGHQAGDEALVHLIKVVRKTLRPTDIVARYGGEEFIILFSDTELASAVQTTRRLQRELTKRFFLHNNERMLITFSAGVAKLVPGESPESVFGRADKAMYQAKIQGKNRVVSAE